MKNTLIFFMLVASSIASFTVNATVYALNFSYLKKLLYAICTSTALVVTQLQASTITVNYESQYLLGTNGSTPTDVTTLVKSNFDAAVDWWTAALPTNKINLYIDVKLKDLDSDVGFTRYDSKDAQGFVDTSTIWFNNVVTDWFLDATPQDDNEFTMVTSTLNQNGATSSTVNSGRYSTASTIGNNYDFLSVAKHEIGHALGLGFNAGDPANYVLYENEVTPDNDIDIDNEFATLFGGFFGVLPVFEIDTTGSHFDGGADGGVFNNTLMALPGFGIGQRTIQSDLDILAVGSIYDLAIDGINLNPIHAVPLPAAIWMFLSGIIGLGMYGKRSRKDRH